MVLLQQSGCVNEQSVLKFQCTKYLHDSIEETEKGEENYTNNNYNNNNNNTNSSINPNNKNIK
jgi:hypothetical protein